MDVAKRPVAHSHMTVLADIMCRFHRQRLGTRFCLQKLGDSRRRKHKSSRQIKCKNS